MMNVQRQDKGNDSSYLLVKQALFTASHAFTQYTEF